MNNDKLNLPFTGIATFAKLPYHPDLETLDSDVAIVGAPYDLTTQVRPGARYGPRGIRVASAAYGSRNISSDGEAHARYYDAESDDVFLDNVRIVDVGDVDIIHGKPEVGLSNVQSVIERVLNSGAMPVTLGGDHSVPIPILRALREEGPIFVVQLDAHLDFVDEIFGVTEGHGNVMRRISEMEHVSGIAQIGIRGVGSSAQKDFEDARQMGSKIVTVPEFRRAGISDILDRIPAGSRFYVTIDCDVFDPSIMSGTGSLSPGGFNYYEVVDFLRGLTLKGDVVGFDFMEVAPMYDPTDVTGQTASRVILDFLGAIFKAREKSHIR